MADTTSKILMWGKARLQQVHFLTVMRKICVQRWPRWSEKPPQKWIVTAVLEQISSPLMLLSVRVALEGQEHNKICFQPRSLSQLSYPWVWYPPPFPLCSLWPLSLSLHCYLLSIVKWRSPPPLHQQNVCQSCGFQGASTPKLYSMQADTCNCVHTQCFPPFVNMF